MIASWVLYSVVVGLLCALAARACEPVMRSLGRPVRWVWVAALGGAMALSVMALVSARTPAPVTSGDAIVVDAVPSEVAPLRVPGAFARTMAAVQGAAGVAGSVMTAVGGLVERAVRSAPARAAAGAFALLWIAVSAALFIVLLFTFDRMRRARRSWRPHLIGDATVLVSRGDGPALVGLLSPAIVVPAWLLHESFERQQLVVRHEREHQRAHDQILLALACAAVCLLPWNAALWWMLRRMRLAVELDCDARVLRGGAPARSYGMLLLDIAGHASAARPFHAPALVDARTHLERRVLAMTENRTVRPLRAAGAGAAALLLAAAACTTDLPTAAQIDKMDVNEVEYQATQAGLVQHTGDGPVYIVDGVIVTEAEARALAPDQIAAIEVMRHDAAVRAYGEVAVSGAVLVRTRAREARAVDEVRAFRMMRDDSLGALLRLRSAEGELVEVPVSADRTKVTDAEMRERRLVETRARSGVATGEAGRERVAVVDGVRISEGSRERVALTDEALRSAAVRSPEAGGRVRLRSDGEAEVAVASLRKVPSPLIVIDGVIVHKDFMMADLAPNTIERIEIVKGEAARRLYDDPRAANGVISITTKR
jgi:beta-lactamase regulating signal transducer with metallopeptidase domain